MASVTYGKCSLWQKYYVKCNYGKNIMANETEPGGGGKNRRLGKTKRPEPLTVFSVLSG